ncbi:aldose 1-epimerase [Marinoscillum furvescens]|uniref:Aldose 1-epimerase n=1 Tax=Marinoscillum furvescens DSM 4134 TaxID=1122208 RepID=A0A3D9KZQ6_MARFU|nr:hypothetical protein [Marinoscillum furvescens]RED96130.1 aldose 1-epimerase [Marinoscillum furvescens DSM 4134]
MEFKFAKSGDIERVVLIDGEEVLMAVAPQFGAKVTQLHLQVADAYHSVLWPASDADLLANDWYKQSILFPYPNRLRDGKYTFEGEEFQFPINEPATNNQLHGMVYNSSFEVVDTTASPSEASLKLVHEYDGGLDYYPFPFRLSVTYTHTKSDFKVLFELENTGNRTLPYGLGWHPYFQFNGESINNCTFICDGLEQVVLADRSLPNGERKLRDANDFVLAEHELDHAYQIKGANRSYTLANGTIKLDFEVSEAMDYLQLFTPPGRAAVAVEPMTCNVNAFENGEGLKILAAGDSVKEKVCLKLVGK